MNFLLAGKSISVIPDGGSREYDLSSQLTIKIKAIDIDHRITKQQYTTLFPLNGIWVVERPVVWHAKKNILAVGLVGI